MLIPWALSLFEKGWLFSGGIVVIVFAAAGSLWLLRGSGPRRRRAHERALLHLERSDWRQALEALAELRNLGEPPASWQSRVTEAEVRAHLMAGDSMLQKKMYEKALEHYGQAAAREHRPDAHLRNRVVESMLAEIRRLYATAATSETERMIERLLPVQPNNGEALFWRALCQLREGDSEKSAATLEAARSAVQEKVLDPVLYLGALLLRSRKTQAALPYLAEANRIAPQSPFVGWQLGMALADGSAESLALSTLNRALGARGLGAWCDQPRQAWIAGLPENSFVHRLATEHEFVCPLMGSDVRAMIAEGRLTFAACQLRRGHFAEARQAYEELYKQGLGGVAVRRGLGMALVRMGRYDEAFEHLSVAQEQEQPKDPLTAGHLALCALRRKPRASEDQASLVAWATHLLGGFDARGDSEWAGLCSMVLARARELDVRVQASDQVALCDALASVDAVEPEAADAYHQLAASAPDRLSAEHAALYCRAAWLHRLRRAHELEIFARLFADEPAARRFYGQRGWDFRDVEYTYLERYSARHPGSFPQSLGFDFSERAEHTLLARSREQLECGDHAAAAESAEVLLRLAPDNARVLDWLAYLSYRQNNDERALALLNAAHAAAPADHWPLVRLAVLQARRGNAEACAAAVDAALGVTAGRLRAAIAFLGARLIARLSWLQGGSADQRNKPEEIEQKIIARPAEVARFLQECHKADDGHLQARCWLAGIYSIVGNRDGLASLAVGVRTSEGDRPEVHLLAALCHEAASDAAAVVGECNLAAAEPSLSTRANYLRGRARLRLGEHAAAARDLEAVIAAEPKAAIAGRARVLLGNCRFLDAAYEEALRQWCSVDAATRTSWRIDEPLRQTVYLTGLLVLVAGRPQEAAAILAEAQRLGVPCHPLTELARFKAAQRLLHAGSTRASISADERAARLGAAARFLEQLVQEGSQDPQLLYYLANVHRSRGAYVEARAALGRIGHPDAAVFLQLGLLSLRERQLAQAEKEFARCCELDPANRAGWYNLTLTRLSLGRLKEARDAVGPLVATLADGDDRLLFERLQDLLYCCAEPGNHGGQVARLAQMPAALEQRLLHLAHSLERPETADRLMEALQKARGESEAIREARWQGILVKAKARFDRCWWSDAMSLLEPLLGAKDNGSAVPAAVLNLAGCCACLTGKHSDGAAYFAAAAAALPNDPRIQQNLALAQEWSGHLADSEQPWVRYLDLLDERIPQPAEIRHYHERLTYYCLDRLADIRIQQQHWSDALGYTQRAHQLRPQAHETLEKLFKLFRRLNRLEDARWVQRRLQQLQPNEPEYELLAIDVMELISLEDVERLADVLEPILQNPRSRQRVEPRSGEVINAVIKLLNELSEQLGRELERAEARVRRLKQDGGRTNVDDSLDYLRARFGKLHSAAFRCLPLAPREAQRVRLGELGEEAGRQANRCRALQS
jgi:predicted Zn-dependent protease